MFNIITCDCKTARFAEEKTPAPLMTCHYMTSAGTCVSGLVGSGPIDERIVDEGFEQRQQRLAALAHRLQYVLARQPEQTLHIQVRDITGVHRGPGGMYSHDSRNKPYTDECMTSRSAQVSRRYGSPFSSGVCNNK